MFDNLRADFQAAMGDRKLESGSWRVLLHVEMPALLCYRYSHWVSHLQIPVVRQLLLVPALLWQRFNQLFLGVFISPDAEIGPGMVIHTPQGLYIPPVKIGQGATFQSGVLIGSGCKEVADNVYFGAGCKIVGDCKIGNNVVIVANSVVITDVPDNTTIMGVPARIKLPGGKPRRFPWRAAQPSDKPNGADGKPNGSGTKPNGSAPKIHEPEIQTPNQQTSA
jgi:serine O-acetyltransferase